MIDRFCPTGLSGRTTSRIRVWTQCVLVLLAGTALSAADVPTQGPQAAKAPEFQESWQVLYAGKTRIGFGRSSTERKMRAGKEIIITDTEMSMVISRFGQVVKSKTFCHTEETPEGELLTFESEMQNPPAATNRTSGKVKDGKLILETDRGTKPQTSELDWDAKIKAPGYQDRILRENPLKAGETRKIQTFEPQFGKINMVTLAAGQLEPVKLLGGETRKLLKVAVTSSVAPGVTLNEYLDDEGQALVTRMSLLDIVTYKVSKEEALQEISGAEADLAVATLVKTDRLDRSHQTSQVVYRITIPGEDPAKILPLGPTQEIRRIDDHTVDLTVLSIVPPEMSAAGAAPAQAEYLVPNSYIQSDDDLIQERAAEAAEGAEGQWATAQQLERWVYQSIRKKNFSTLLASAAEVVKDRTGDCTEHAVLLAALARAQKIPSRVAVGLVYVPAEASFGGHMWSEVYINGVWTPLDGTLGRGIVAADHIKFADSSFSEDSDIAPLSTFMPLVSVLGKIKIEVKEIRYR